MRSELVVLVLGFMFSASTLLMVPPLPAKLSVNATEEEKQQRVVLMKERRRCQVAVNHDKRAKGLDRTSESIDAVAASSIETNNKRTTSDIAASNSKRATSDIAASNSKRARGSERTEEEVDAVAASNIGTNGKRAKGTERTTEEVDAKAEANKRYRYHESRKLQ